MPSENSCINNLRQIDNAKQMWAQDNKKADTDMPTSDDIKVYIKNSTFPKCPKGGSYSIGRVNEDPKCSIGGDSHSRPAP